MTKTLLLVLFFQIKHFLADFVFQNQKIASNKGKSLYYLFLHSLHHSSLTLITLTIFNFSFVSSILIATSEILSHSFIDFLKANEKIFGRYQFPSKLYFVFLGLDQLIHQINYLLIVGFLIS